MNKLITGLFLAVLFLVVRESVFAEDLGGNITGTPAVSSWSDSRLDVFARGVDGHLWHRAWDVGKWYKWEDLGGQILYSPTAVSWGPDRIDIFAAGANNHLWHIAWTKSGWSKWQDHGGNLKDSPAAASWGPNRIDVFTAGMDDAAWHIAWDGKAWSKWQSIGGKIIGAPAAVSWGPNRIDVFARGANKALWHTAWADNKWFDWQQIETTITSNPAAASTASNRLQVFARALNQKLLVKVWNGSGWEASKELNPAGDSAVAAVAISNTIHLFSRGSQQQVVREILEQWTSQQDTTTTGDSLKVADNVKNLSATAGEAQSTIVPPGKNSSCSAGRILVSNDLKLLNSSGAPAPGSVIGKDLSSLAQTIHSTFEPGPADRRFGTNDHDLVSLRNGDVLFITGAFSRTALDPEPGWFDDTNRGDFGPGARYVVLTWRSTDCGTSFQFASELDSAKIEDGSCALPQFRTSGKPDYIRYKEKPYDMGGSDGQLIKVDPSNDNIYMSFQCVGYLQDTSNTKEFILSETPLSKTLVARSTDHGNSWKSLGFVNIPGWRFGMVPVQSGRLGLGFSNALLFAKENSSGTLMFDSTAVRSPLGDWGWDVNPIPENLVNVNMVAHTIVARTPDSKNMSIAFPDTIPGKGHGYRLFFYDRDSKMFGEAAPIVPVENGNNNFVMHLVAIDYGKGPVLLYWYDVNTTTKNATIRGRLILGEGQYSKDFSVSQHNGSERSFSLSTSLTASGPFWYGDYLTASGFAAQKGGVVKAGSSNTTYTYYPMWPEPDGTVRYTSVSYNQATNQIDPIAIVIPKEQWKPESEVVPIDSIGPAERSFEEFREYSMLKQNRKIKQ